MVMSCGRKAGMEEGSRVLLLCSAGMGHLIPCVRLAAALSGRSMAVKLVAARSTVSEAESRLLCSLPPSLSLLDFPLSDFDASLFPPSSDPFFLKIEAIRRSAHLLPDFIAAHSPVSSLIVDVFLASSVLPIAKAAAIPSFVFFTSSASMLALLCAALPSLDLSCPLVDDVIVRTPWSAGPALEVPNSSLPPPFRDPAHLFTFHAKENARSFHLADGIIVNTFAALESEVLAALNAGQVLHGLPPVTAVGPLPAPSIKEEPLRSLAAMKWLEEQPGRSVVFVSFGSRTALSREQTRELGGGLEMSGCRFLWVLKSGKVDREEAATAIEEMVGEGYVERVGGRGMVLREWVDQEAVLRHPSVGAFLSHCGWNSAMEAAAAGARVLAWPRIGDQRVNAAVVARGGLGLWPQDWAWEADEGVVVGREDIAAKLREVMADASLAERVANMAACAREAIHLGGSSDLGFRLLATKLSASVMVADSRE